MEYRREIDGLLAIAVLSVILFHAGFECARGGFLGVDVFYVISGYLITSIIARELRAGTFSLTAFYERRVRRILPALFAVMLSCLPAAWWYLDPAEMKSFASSLVAAATFSSNFLFWRTSGYFAPAAELKPLLHTWTLAVEEQFYLLYPLIMLLAWRWTKGNVGALVVAIGVASLAAAHALVTAMPAVAFYLLPTRAWQLLLGAMAAIYLPADRVRPLSPVFRQLLGSAGLALVIGAATLLHKDLPLPSAWSLVPTLGALLVLVFATRDTWTGRLLASPPAVGIGLISYSAYLWHQPLISFTRHARLDEPGRPLMLALVCLTLAMAYLSWRYGF